MQVLFLSNHCDGLSSAVRVANEGHRSLMFSRYGNGYGSGLVEHVDTWREHLRSSDLVVSCSPYFITKEPILRSNARAYIGASDEANVIFKEKLADFLKFCNIEGPGTFTGYDFYMIHGFFNGRNWARPFIASLQEVHLFPKRIGPVVDPMGSVIKQIKHEPVCLEQLVAGLKKLSIRDLVTIVMSKDHKIVSMFCGLDTDILDCISEGIKTTLSDVLFECASGVLSKLDITNDYIVCVKLTAPPFPYSSAGPNGTFDVSGLDDNNLRHVHLYEVTKIDGKYVSTPKSGLIMNVTARGQDIQEARRRVYRTVSNIDFPAKQYRHDIGQDIDKIFQGDLKGLIDA